MRREIGPIIAPGPAGDEYRRSRERMEALEIQQARRNRALQLLDTVLPDSPEKRKLASSMGEDGREIKKDRESLTQNQSKWQKGTGEIIQDILKLADYAVELYEPYQEYPLNDNFKDYDEDKGKAAKRRDYTIYLINQSIALYYHNVIQDLEKLQITDKPEFKEVEHFLHTLKAKMSERADLEKAVMEFERQAGLAQFQLARSREHNGESANHSHDIQRLSNTIGCAPYVRRLWKASDVRDYSEQAEKRAKELESVLAHVEKHRQDTEEKIGVYLSQAQKRADADKASTALHAKVSQIETDSHERATDSATRAAYAAGRATIVPITDTTYKDIADNIISTTTAGLHNTDIITLTRRTEEAATRTEEAATRAREAAIRDREAAIRAREAAIRARIAKAHGDPKISDEAAKDVEKHAKNVEKLEKKVAEIANLIEAQEKIIEAKLEIIKKSLQDMDTIVRDNTSGLTDKHKEELQELAKRIEKAEISKNKSIASQTHVIIMEQTALENIRDELQHELAALTTENVTEKFIATKAKLDRRHLQSLVDQQKALEETLRGTPTGGSAIARTGLIERERAQSQAMHDIEQAILNRENDIRTLKTREETCRDDVDDRRNEFATALTDVMNAEREVAAVLKRNDLHMERDVMGDADQAVERLQKTKDNFAAQDDERLKNRSKGHLFIDPKVGKFTVNGVWMSVREVDRWDFSVPDQTTIDFRPDIVKIEVETITREAQGGKLSVEPVYTKRLSERYFRSADFEYTLKIPGPSYADKGRREGIMEIIDLKKKDGKMKKEVEIQAEAAYKLAEKAKAGSGPAAAAAVMAAKGAAAVAATAAATLASEGTTTTGGLLAPPTSSGDVHDAASTVGGDVNPAVTRAIKALGAEEATKIFNAAAVWTKEEYTREHKFNMEAAGSIKIKENHNNQSYPVEVLFSTTVETMPDPVVNHAAAFALRQGPGWSDAEKRRMCKLDLDRQVLILPNGQEYGMKEFDWTETKWDEENGLTLQYKGPKELSQVNLMAAGSADIFDEKLSEATIALKKKKRQHVEDGIEWLKQAIKSYDEGKINAALGSLQSAEGMVSYYLDQVDNDMQKPPRTRLDLERLKKKKKAQRKALTPEWMARSIESTAGMLGARRGYENEVKKRIRAIHQHDSLSAKDVWKSRANPEKHTSSQKKLELLKLELLKEIRAAEHLDETLSFQLLEDPKQGLASTTSPVKNAKPNGLELLQEYNRYKNKPDFADERERQNVAQYVKVIETEFRTNPNIHFYFRNQWYLEQAITAAKRGQFLSKDVEGEHIIGASEYIRKLKQVDCPPPSDKSLAGLRQADEYHWVTYLRNALIEAETAGMAELLKQALFVAKQMQECGYSNFNLAQSALDFQTPSQEATRMVDDMRTPEIWPKVDQKPTVSKDHKPDGKIDPKAITKKSDGELALEAGNTSKQIYKQVVDTVEHLIASTDDPVLQRRYREDATKMAMDLAKQAFQINKQDKEIQNQWQKLEVYIKEVNTQRWKDFWFTLAIFAFQQGPRAGAEGVKKFMDEILKIIGKSVG